MLSAVIAICLTGNLHAVGVSLENLSQTYDGAPKVPVVTTNPPGLGVDLVYRNLSNPGSVSEVVFNNSPDPLALSYPSVALNVNAMCGVGNYLHLGGSARKLESCEVTMVTWAKAESYPSLAALDLQGYHHPVTLSFYRVTDSNQLVYLTEVERSIFVPWRPLALPNGDPYPVNGCAFRAVFDFPNGITLPEKVVALVSFNTQNAGFAPTGLPGPYNELNVAISSATPSMGSDADPGSILKVVYDSGVAAGIWSFPNISLGSSYPMMRVRAVSTQTKTPPVNAGNYQITASISDSTYAGGALGTLSIGKAPAQIQMSNLDQFYTGGTRPVSVSTNPPALPVVLTYAGVSDPPSAVGTYAVSVAIDSPNYMGQAGGLLSVRSSYQSWIEGVAGPSGIPESQTGDHDDPDGDGISNLMEYALNSNPSLASESISSLPVLGHQAGAWTFTYRRNLAAADLSYTIECQSELSQLAPWAVIAGEETVLSDDGQSRLIQVSLPVSPLQNRSFYRLCVNR